jgi:hypothetical protein
MMNRQRAPSQLLPEAAAPASSGRRRWLASSIGRVALSGVMAVGLIDAVLARPVVPPAPPVEAGGPNAAGEPGPGPRDLTPAQRQAIRQLSREQREALGSNPRARPGAPGVPGARLTPLERRQLRAQIREEHERNGKGRFGSGKRP